MCFSTASRKLPELTTVKSLSDFVETNHCIASATRSSASFAAFICKFRELSIN